MFKFKKIFSLWKRHEEETHWPIELKIPTKLLIPTELSMNIDFQTC